MAATGRRPIAQIDAPREPVTMAPRIPLQLTSDDKLDVLRYLDEFRYWHSLDDKRHCNRCHRTITGRQILVVELPGTRGKLRLQCPTVACVSTPSDWGYADPVLAAKLRANPVRDDRGTTTIAAHRTHPGNSVARTHAKPAGAKPPGAVQKIKRRMVSFRAVVARWPLLRPLATGLHAIRPVA